MAERVRLSVRGLPQHATITLLAGALHLTGPDCATFEVAAGGGADERIATPDFLGKGRRRASSYRSSSTSPTPPAVEAPVADEA